MNKFEELYNLSYKITKKFDELFYLTFHKVDIKSLEFESLLEEIKILVLQENAQVSIMTIEEVDSCINELIAIINNNFEVTPEDDLTSFEGLETCLKILIDKCDCTEKSYDADALLRAFDRLKNQTYILSEEGIKLNFRQNNNPIISYKVSVWDAIVSIINIEINKSIQNKIFSTTPTQENDYKFIKELKNNLICLKMTVLFGNFTSEIYALYANTDINKIADSDVNKIIQVGAIDKDTFSNLMLTETKNIVDDLATITKLEYNPDNVFGFLRLVTSFEIFVSHLDLESLRKINDYCEKSTNNKNYPCMSGITNFTKMKVKKKEQQ